MERSQLEENILLCLLFGPESIGDPVSPEFLHYLKVRWSKNNFSLCIKVEPGADATKYCLSDICSYTVQYLARHQKYTVASAPTSIGLVFTVYEEADCFFSSQYTKLYSTHCFLLLQESSANF